MNDDLDVAIRQLLDGERVVKVLCVIGVDGEGEHLAHVAPAGDLGGLGLLGPDSYFFRFFLCAGREVGAEAFVQDDRLHFHVVLTGTPEDLEDLARGRLHGVVPAGDLGEGLFAVLGPHGVLLGDQNVFVHLGVLRDEVGDAVDLFDRSHEFHFVAGDDLNHLAALTLAADERVQCHTHGIVVECGVKELWRDLNVLIESFDGEIPRTLAGDTDHTLDSLCAGVGERARFRTILLGERFFCVRVVSVVLRVLFMGHI